MSLCIMYLAACLFVRTHVRAPYFDGVFGMQLFTSVKMTVVRPSNGHTFVVEVLRHEPDDVDGVRILMERVWLVRLGPLVVITIFRGRIGFRMRILVSGSHLTRTSVQAASLPSLLQPLIGCAYEPCCSLSLSRMTRTRKRERARHVILACGCAGECAGGSVSEWMHAPRRDHFRMSRARAEGACMCRGQTVRAFCIPSSSRIRQLHLQWMLVIPNSNPHIATLLLFLRPGGGARPGLGPGMECVFRRERVRECVAVFFSPVAG